MAITLLAACLLLLLAALFVMIRKESAGRQIDHLLSEEMRLGREEAAKNARDLREEVSAGQKTSSEITIKTMEAMAAAQKESLSGAAVQIMELTKSNESKLEALRSTIDNQLRQLHENNEKKLEQMRATVDEKLHSTLEKRLGESFKQVSEHLEAVQRGLGEMQSLATGVGDLKRVLTNVKTRGTWGEVQLGAILEQLMTPDQYARNVKTNESSSEMVEFAIKLPGSNDGDGSHIWLPIDAKFPQEDYLRLVEASDAADAEAVKKAHEALIRAVENSARDIRDKYVNPPATTDFAIMFLPTEGLYAEVLRNPGCTERVQHNYRIVIAGPTTLSAILTSLRTGFRTLAIEKRSSEVWQILAAVKTEFDKFATILSKVKKQLKSAENTIDQTETRTRVMQRKLKDVEQLPEQSAAEVIGLPEAESLTEDEPG